MSILFITNLDLFQLRNRLTRGDPAPAVEIPHSHGRDNNVTKFNGQGLTHDPPGFNKVSITLWRDSIGGLRETFA